MTLGKDKALMPQFPLVGRVMTVAASSSFYKESQEKQARH